MILKKMLTLSFQMQKILNQIVGFITYSDVQYRKSMDIRHYVMIDVFAVSLQDDSKYGRGMYGLVKETVLRGGRGGSCC